MNKIDLFYGFVIGLIVAFIGIYAFIYMATPYSFVAGVQMMQMKGSLGKLITLGAVLNLIAFFALLKTGRDLMARGIILATITLAIATLIL